MLRVTAISRDSAQVPYDIVVLDHAERHLRRRVITLQHGEDALVDLPRATVLADRDRLVLDDGRHVEVIAADEALLEVRAGSSVSLAELAWHIGNRHLPAQIEAERILLERDHVVRDMLRGMGARLCNVREPFAPVRGAYHRHQETAGEETGR